MASKVFKFKHTFCFLKRKKSCHFWLEKKNMRTILKAENFTAKHDDDEHKSFNHVDGFSIKKYFKRKLINYISVIPSHHYLISLHSRLAPKHDLFHLIYTCMFVCVWCACTFLASQNISFALSLLMQRSVPI